MEYQTEITEPSPWEFNYKNIFACKT